MALSCLYNKNNILALFDCRPSEQCNFLNINIVFDRTRIKNQRFCRFNRVYIKLFETFSQFLVEGGPGPRHIDNQK
jgi:hypothetical protein